MASSPGGGASSATSSDHHHQEDVMDQKKRKRMISNRESARRSRMKKKQQHLDDLVRQVGELRKENEEIMKNLSLTSQLHMNMEAENAILRTQMAELTNRLESLNEIISYINSSSSYVFNNDDETEMISDCGLFNNWNQPIMAAGGNNNMMYY
ncbi:bZIP transcription factor 11-like [Neltuma alba]|uniref:bZIP transcription factor 11-like n=1 Tax=Neltuma alba TaxID=207710 RepID=UPI0010A3D23C|nr:bZIP transcription factor 11-like [Prosopis alba]